MTRNVMAPRPGAVYSRWTMADDSAAPHSWRPFRDLLRSVLGWTAVASAMSAALVSDAVRRGNSVDLWGVLADNLPSYVPLMLLSWCLAAWFDGPRPRGVGVRDVLPVMLVVFLGFLPLYVVIEAGLFTLAEGRSLSTVGKTLAAQRRFIWWVDLIVVAGAMAVQLALTAHRVQREQATALLRERNVNLSLRLTLLQGQLEPHFLFNALNGIASLVRSGDRADALAALARVSDLLRFALRASRRPWVSVAEELAFIESWLALQTLRLGDRMQVVRRIADADWTTLRCPPLLFQPLVENAVRHGVETTVDPATIVIDLEVRDAAIRLLIDNPLPPDDSASGAKGHGLGLALTRQRLEALYGSGAVLTAERSDGRFRTTLVIPAEDTDGAPVGPDR